FRYAHGSWFFGQEIFIRAPVPDLDRAGAILARGNAPRKGSVAEWMIFDVHRQPLLPGVECRFFGNGPALQYAVRLQPEVIVQAGGIVFLDHEDGTTMPRLALRGRLGSFAEISFRSVFLQLHACSNSKSHTEVAQDRFVGTRIRN